MLFRSLPLYFFFLLFCMHHASPCITTYLTGLTCEHLINFLLSDLRISPLIAYDMPERTALHLKAGGGKELGVVAGSTFHSLEHENKGFLSRQSHLFPQAYI